MSYCGQCGAKNEGTKFCPECGAPQAAPQKVPVSTRARAIEPPSDKEVAHFEKNGDVKLDIKSVPDAKLALKQLRLRKRELGAAKKVVMEEQRQIRAGYTEKVRERGSKFGGGGGVGRFVRAVQSASRDADRKQLAKNLEPYEEQRSRLEAAMNVIDRAILQVENYIAQSS